MVDLYQCIHFQVCKIWERDKRCPYKCSKRIDGGPPASEGEAARLLDKLENGAQYLKWTDRERYMTDVVREWKTIKATRPTPAAQEGTIYVEGKGQKLHGKSVERVIVNKGADRHCTGTAQKEGE